MTPCVMRLIRTIGVSPMASRMLSQIFFFAVVVLISTADCTMYPTADYTISTPAPSAPSAPSTQMSGIRVTFKAACEQTVRNLRGGRCADARRQRPRHSGTAGACRVGRDPCGGVPGPRSSALAAGASVLLVPQQRGRGAGSDGSARATTGGPASAGGYAGVAGRTTAVGHERGRRRRRRRQAPRADPVRQRDARGGGRVAGATFGADCRGGDHRIGSAGRRFVEARLVEQSWLPRQRMARRSRRRLPDVPSPRQVSRRCRMSSLAPDQWLQKVEPNNVPDAAAVVFALGDAIGDLARSRVTLAAEFLRRSQGRDGGVGSVSERVERTVRHSSRPARAAIASRCRTRAREGNAGRSTCERPRLSRSGAVRRRQLAGNHEAREADQLRTADFDDGLVAPGVA